MNNTKSDEGEFKFQERILELLNLKGADGFHILYIFQSCNYEDYYIATCQCDRQAKLVILTVEQLEDNSFDIFGFCKGAFLGNVKSKRIG